MNGGEPIITETTAQPPVGLKQELNGPAMGTEQGDGSGGNGLIPVGQEIPKLEQKFEGTVSPVDFNLPQSTAEIFTGVTPTGYSSLEVKEDPSSERDPKSSGFWQHIRQEGVLS